MSDNPIFSAGCHIYRAPDWDFKWREVHANGTFNSLFPHLAVTTSSACGMTCQDPHRYTQACRTKRHRATKAVNSAACQSIITLNDQPPPITDVRNRHFCASIAFIDSGADQSCLPDAAIMQRV